MAKKHPWSWNSGVQAKDFSLKKWRTTRKSWKKTRRALRFPATQNLRKRKFKTRKNLKSRKKLRSQTLIAPNLMNLWIQVFFLIRLSISEFCKIVPKVLCVIFKTNARKKSKKLSFSQISKINLQVILIAKLMQGREVLVKLSLCKTSLLKAHQSRPRTKKPMVYRISLDSFARQIMTSTLKICQKLSLKSKTKNFSTQSTNSIPNQFKIHLKTNQAKGMKCVKSIYLWVGTCWMKLK